MNNEQGQPITRKHYFVLVALNILTLLAMVLVYFSQPPEDPKFSRLVEMVEAQDWLIGKTSEKLREQTVELVKLQFGQDVSDPAQELEDLLGPYEAQRKDIGLDLDRSRKKMDAAYHEMISGDEPEELNPTPPRPDTPGR